MTRRVCRLTLSIEIDAQTRCGARVGGAVHVCNENVTNFRRKASVPLRPGWFIIATCKVHALCRGLARFRPALRCAGARRPLPAHPRPNKRDIHVLNEYTVTSGCRPSSSPSGSSRASRTTAQGPSSRRRSNGHLCREGAVAVQWSRRRAGARPPSFRHHPRMRARRSSRTLHALCLRSRRRDDGAASPFTLCRARATLGAKPCACARHHPCIARLRDAP